jgi:alpha-tubulin suppressor-like RCC1 family protein
MDRTSYLATIHAHPNDTRIAFDDASHTYTLDESPLPASVTAIYAAHFDTFDSAATLRSYMGRWAEDENNKYFQLIQYLKIVAHKTPAECEGAIARLWEANGAAKAQLGTDMHAQIEQLLNVDPSQPLSQSNGDASRPPPPLSPELRQYEAFRRDVPLARGWTPYRTEWSIFDATSLVGGSVDALYADRGGALHMVDWKRSSKDLSPHANHWGRFGRAGGVLAHVKDTPFDRYSMQQNLYRHILETGYYDEDGNEERARMPGPIVSMHLAQFHPSLDTYRFIPVCDMRDEARDLMARFRGSAAFQEATRRRAERSRPEESILLGVLGKDFGDNVFKYLAPRTIACLETTFTSELIFVPLGGVQALMRSVAQRRHAEAAAAGATLEALGEEQGGRVTWSAELQSIYMAMGRARVGVAKKMISAGWAHSLVTTGKQGEIWSFGKGGDGQLGHGGRGNEVVPRLIEALNHVVVRQVAAGMYHSMALTRGGDVLTWGDAATRYHDFGQLGHGTMTQQLVPKHVAGPTHATDVAAGSFHSMAVGEGGTVYTWGANEQGQLGLGDHGGGTDRSVPTEVPGNTAVAVFAGESHSFALSRDGRVAACGANEHGQLGLGHTVLHDTFTVVAGPSGVIDMDAGWNHSIAATVEGGLYTWGEGWAIGHGGDHTTQRLVPTKVTGGGIGEAVVVQVAAGLYQSMALTTTSELYSWGDGADGMLGQGDKEDFAVPMVVRGIEGAVLGMAGGDHHSLVGTTEGRVLGCGCNGDHYGGVTRFVDSDGEVQEEPLLVVDGRLGRGVGLEEALTLTVIDGIRMGAGQEGQE